ncbi:oligosaccharide flippase family protein [Bradyrhizobium sp. PMVTL-01]|uniref:oligosaccharide flippase family protein n=1 Tax=Bradyrhizobium sp. PMVTL-01 TaxID=3434999 RepID=UPI003F6FB8A7
MHRSEIAIVMGGMLTQQVTAFVGSVWIARQLGSVGFGELAILKNISTFFLLVMPLGLDLALLKHATLYPPRSAELATMSTSVRSIAAALNVLLIGLTAAWFGPELQKIYHEIDHFSYYCVLTMVGVMLAADVQISGALYRVAGRLKSYSLVASYSQSLMRLTLLIFVLLLGGEVLSVVWVNTIAYISSFLALAYLDSQEVRPPSTISLQSIRESARVLRESIWMAASLLVYQSMRFMDVLVLGALTNVQVTGQYNAISGVAQIIQIYPMAASQMMGPRIAESYRIHALDGIVNELRHYLDRATMLGGYMFAGVAVFGTQLDLVFGKSFQFSWMLSVLLASSWYFSAILSPFGYVLSMTGRHRTEVMILSVGAGILIVSLFALIPMLGDVGAALSVLSGFVTVNAIRCAYVVRILGMNPLRISDIIPPGTFFVGAWIVLHFGSMVLEPSLVSLIIEASLYTFLSLAIYLFIFTNSAQRARLFSRLAAYVGTK